MKLIIFMKPLLWSVALVTGALLLPGCASSGKRPAPANAGEARAYFEVLRSDFNASKIRTLNEVMKLTPGEADKFWPIYRTYEKDMAAVGDRKLVLIGQFVNHSKAGTLTDQNSQELAIEWLQNVQDRLDLWKKYHDQISSAVSPTRAGQFLQIEHQLALFVDISIASEMPLVATTPK